MFAISRLLPAFFLTRLLVYIHLLHWELACKTSFLFVILIVNRRHALRREKLNTEMENVEREDVGYDVETTDQSNANRVRHTACDCHRPTVDWVDHVSLHSSAVVPIRFAQRLFDTLEQRCLRFLHSSSRITETITTTHDELMIRKRSQ